MKKTIAFIIVVFLFALFAPRMLGQEVNYVDTISDEETSNLPLLSSHFYMSEDAILDRDFKYDFNRKYRMYKSLAIGVMVGGSLLNLILVTGPIVWAGANYDIPLYIALPVAFAAPAVILALDIPIIYGTFKLLSMADRYAVSTAFFPAGDNWSIGPALIKDAQYAFGISAGVGFRKTF